MLEYKVEIVGFRKRMFLSMPSVVVADGGDRYCGFVVYNGMISDVKFHHCIDYLFENFEYVYDRDIKILYKVSMCNESSHVIRKRCARRVICK